MNNIPALSPADTLVQCAGNIVSDMDGEKVMLNVDKGKYYNLGEVGGDIWNALAAPASAVQIAERIQSLYEVPGDVAQRDVLAFLRRLLDEGLIRFADSP